MEAYAAGETTPALIEESIGANFERTVAAHGDNEALVEFASGRRWTYAELDKWLLKPSAYAPGTKMSFAGIADPKVRANVIAYLRSLSANPEPLPTAEGQKQPG